LGDKCDYYKALFEVCKMLDLQEAHIIWESFTADVCHRITWAILSNGRSFFNTVLLETQFRRGEQFKWPTSLIYKVTDDVRFANTINRPFYPPEWLIGAAGGGGRPWRLRWSRRRTQRGYTKGCPEGAREGKQTKKDATATGEEAAAGNRGSTIDTHKIVAMMADYVVT
jgi:hypothetical protein